MGRRALLGRNRGNQIFTGFNFDTVGTGDAFLIRRVSDNVQQNFTYSEITDGTYAAFVSATQGAVVEWKSAIGSLTNPTDIYQPFLVENAGNPYVDDPSASRSLNLATTLQMDGDWVISLIPKDETNSNNQRANLIVKQDSTNLFAINIIASGQVSMMINREYDAGNAADYYFNNNNAAFTLLTFQWKAGVLKAYSNGAQKTLTVGGYSIQTAVGDNYIKLGGTSTAKDKVTKYRHLGVTTGAGATAIDIATYNSNLMTKYGL